jgi:predicted outer membrane protein
MKSKHLSLNGVAAALAVAAVLILGAAPTTTARVNALHEPHTAAAVTDPQIAAIVVAANTVDIEAGKLAQSKTRNEKVNSSRRR